MYFLSLWKKEKVQLLVAQSCLNLCDPMDDSLPGSSAHGVLQARILEWVVIPFFRESSWPRDWTWVSGIAGRFFFFFKINLLTLIGGELLYNIVMVFAIHWHESATGICMSPPSWSSLSPPSPSQPSRLSQSTGFGFPVSYSKFPLVIYVKHS